MPHVQLVLNETLFRDSSASLLGLSTQSTLPDTGVSNTRLTYSLRTAKAGHRVVTRGSQSPSRISDDGHPVGHVASRALPGRHIVALGLSPERGFTAECHGTCHSVAFVGSNTEAPNYIQQRLFTVSEFSLTFSATSPDWPNSQALPVCGLSGLSWLSSSRPAFRWRSGGTLGRYPKLIMLRRPTFRQDGSPRERG